MIALEQERGRKKCEVYWPTVVNREQTWGKARVTLLEETHKEGIFTERRMSVRYGDRPGVAHFFGSFTYAFNI